MSRRHEASYGGRARAADERPDLRIALLERSDHSHLEQAGLHATSLAVRRRRLLPENGRQQPLLGQVRCLIAAVTVVHREERVAGKALDLGAAGVPVLHLAPPALHAARTELIRRTIAELALAALGRFVRDRLVERCAHVEPGEF
jgi:hypothetical protein